MSAVAEINYSLKNVNHLSYKDKKSIVEMLMNDDTHDYIKLNIIKPLPDKIVIDLDNLQTYNQLIVHKIYTTIKKRCDYLNTPY